MNLGIAYLNLSQHSKAFESLQQALSLYRAVGNRFGEASTQVLLGNAYHRLSQYAKAIEYYQQALPIFRQVGNRNSEALTLNSLGNAYHRLSQYAKAIEYHQQALPVYRQVGNRNGEANTLNSLGSAYNFLSQYAKAIEYHQQALPIYRQVGNRNGEANTLNSLGSAYHRLSQYGRAIEYYQQTLSIYRQVGNRNGEANTLNNLGWVYAELSQYSKAVALFQQGLPILRQLGDRQGEAATLGNLGNVYAALSRYGTLSHYDSSKVNEYYQQALTIYRQVGDRQGEASTLGNLGKVYRSLSQYGRAIEYYQQALSIFRQMGNRNGEAMILDNLGSAYNFLSQYGRATEYYQQALLIYRQVGDRFGEGTALNNLGDVSLKIRNVTSAEKTLFAAITVWESLRPGLTDENKVSLFDETPSITYRTLQKALVAQNKFISALEIAERGRTRAFIELLAKRLAPSSINSSLVSSANQFQIRQIARTHNTVLVQYSIIYDDFQIQGKIEPRESALYIWVIQPNGEIAFRQVDLKPLWQQHNATLKDLVVGNQEFLAVRSRRSDRFTQPQPDLPTLHQLLIDPIASLLPKDPKARVIFIPQGSLFQVPFPALQDAKGSYLIQKHTILTAPSIQILDLTRQQQQKLANRQPKPQGEALVLGNPTMPQDSSSAGTPKQPLAALPGAEAEARAVAPLLDTKPITGAQGTKALIKQKMLQAPIIHLATHGLLDEVSGLGSAIALSPSSNDNGWLTAEEILEMRLQADLVVLSACNTAEGRITGDGVIGLSRSLISAGAPSVIVSLWAVPDAPTALLMQTFYQNLQQHPDKAQALRQAMLTTMKTHPEPRDWAAFTLIGESD